MKIELVSETRVSILDVSPEQFAVILDAVDELNRKGSPRRPFSRDFQGWLDGVRLELSKGAKLFRAQLMPQVATVYHLRPGASRDLDADSDEPVSL